MKRVLLCLILLISVLAQVSIAVEYYDLTSPGSSVTINGAIFMQFNPSEAAGTGVFDAFLGIKNSPIEHGYNTDGALEFDTVGGGHTHSIQLSDVQIVNVFGTDFRELLLDLNENTPNSHISLDMLEIYVEDVCDLSGYPGCFTTMPVFDLDDGNDRWIEMDYNLNDGGGGSGVGDIAVLVPSSLFGTDEAKYVYLYTKMGVNVSADAGFEEWGVGVGGPVIPEPATLLLLGFGGLALLKKSRR